MSPLWSPSSDSAQSGTAKFMHVANTRYGLTLTTYQELDEWSVENPEYFWSLVWDFSGVIADHKGTQILSDKEHMPGARWFPDARLNFAENLLRRRDGSEALVFWGEDVVKRHMSYRELYDAVSQLRQALIRSGVVQGDRVAGYLPNMPEAVVAMLATASIGALWSSCSPDFGVQGVLDRFVQIQPKVILAVDGYFNNGKVMDCLEKLPLIAAGLGEVQVVVVPYVHEPRDLPNITYAVWYADYTNPFVPSDIPFVQLPFNHPLYIVFSSGTTGAPKCIVHSAGGTLLQHLKEHLLHVDIRDNDRLFYSTTCGWMMWNWLVSALSLGITLLLYDGYPLKRRGMILWDFADAEKMTVFGTSAKYIENLLKAGIAPRTTHALNNLRVMLSTGSPLLPKDFDYVYEHVKPDIRLSSISGGTDIISCFLQGSPLLPVWRGELQCRGLGLRVEIFNSEGRPVREEKGELVCSAPFPAMPIGFWNDPEDRKYHAAYFQKFPGVWHHGDFAELTSHEGYILYGRSDAVLNPGGTRIGTAEIYHQVEQLDEVVESIAIGQHYRDDTRIVLFVKLREGLVLDAPLVARIRSQILSNTTSHHVPAKVLQVTDIPRTRNGKITELAVRDAVEGCIIKNLEALANPEALEQFRNHPELRD